MEALFRVTHLDLADKGTKEILVKRGIIFGRYHVLKVSAGGKPVWLAIVRSTGRRAGVFPSLAAARKFVKGKA